MKDLKLKDIFFKGTRALNSVSVYRNGRWDFVTLGSPNKTTEDQSFFRINSVFGIHKAGSRNAANYAVKGRPGDYVSIGLTGEYALVTVEQFDLLFPKPQQTPVSYPTSNNLKNPNYLTKIQQESLPSDSDKVLIGDREFNLPSTANKTITVIETPVGQSKVFYDTSAGAMVYDYESGTMVEVAVPDKPTSSSSPSY